MIGAAAVVARATAVVNVAAAAVPMMLAAVKASMSWEYEHALQCCRKEISSPLPIPLPTPADH
jgi:hypothetical protein